MANVPSVKPSFMKRTLRCIFATFVFALKIKNETSTSALGGAAVTEQSSLISSKSHKMSIAKFNVNVKIEKI